MHDSSGIIKYSVESMFTDTRHQMYLGPTHIGLATPILEDDPWVERTHSGGQNSIILNQ